MTRWILIFTAAIFVLSTYVPAQKVYFQPRVVNFPTDDGGTVTGHLYGRAKRAVVLVHGGRYRKESWRQQANQLTDAGYRVLSIDLRGFGYSKAPGQEDVYSAPIHLDVLAAVRYLRGQGARSVAVIGGSLGGGAGADAVTEARRGEIDRLITLGGLMWNKSPEKVKVPLLVIITKDDASGSGPRLPGIQASFDKIPPGQKRIEILEGSAHAQAMFETDDADRIMELIIKFLKERYLPGGNASVNERAIPAATPPYEGGVAAASADGVVLFSSVSCSSVSSCSVVKIPETTEQEEQE